MTENDSFCSGNNLIERSASGDGGINDIPKLTSALASAESPSICPNDVIADVDLTNAFRHNTRGGLTPIGHPAMGRVPMTFEPRGSVEQRGGARSPSCSVALRPVAVLERCERQIRSV